MVFAPRRREGEGVSAARARGGAAWRREIPARHADWRQNSSEPEAAASKWRRAAAAQRGVVGHDPRPHAARVAATRQERFYDALPRAGAGRALLHRELCAV